MADRAVPPPGRRALLGVPAGRLGGRRRSAPGGRSRAASSPRRPACARRAMEHLGHLHFAYGLSDQAVDIWRATGLEPGEQALEPTEQDLVVAPLHRRRGRPDGARERDPRRGLGRRVAPRYAVIVAHADDDVAAQQARRLAGGGAVERLAQLELERARPRRGRGRARRGRGSAGGRASTSARRPVQAGAAHADALGRELVARADDDAACPRCAGRTAARARRRRGPCAGRR